MWTAISSTRVECRCGSFGASLLDCDERSTSDSSLVRIRGPREASACLSTPAHVTSCSERSAPIELIVVATGSTLAMSCSNSFQSPMVLRRGPEGGRGEGEEGGGGGGEEGGRGGGGGGRERKRRERRGRREGEEEEEEGDVGERDCIHTYIRW